MKLLNYFISRLLVILLRLGWIGFQPIQNEDTKSWGIYHDTAYHRWDYPYSSRNEAQRACDKINDKKGYPSLATAVAA